MYKKFQAKKKKLSNYSFKLLIIYIKYPNIYFI